MPGKSNDQLRKEHEGIKQKPEDLKDTDVEDEYQEGNKKGFRNQTEQGKGNPSTQSAGIASVTDKDRPSNKQLEKEQKQEKLRPEDLKDTDVDDEYKHGNEKGFKKDNTKAKL